MSNMTYSWKTLVYRPKSILLFLAISLLWHGISAIFAYKTNIFSSEDIKSIPSRTISISLVQPTPITPPKPIQPAKLKPKPKPTPKKKEKRKIITKAPSVKKISEKPKRKKRLIKPAPPKVLPKPVVSPLPPTDQPKVTPRPSTSPLPSPVGKPTVFAAPQPSYQPKPKYPLSARRRGQEGTVTLKISIANNGHVSHAIIVKSSGSSALDRSALKTIKMWKFPASKFNGLSTFEQKIKFQLNNY